jgi:hypothetical protein
MESPEKTFMDTQFLESAETQQAVLSEAADLFVHKGVALAQIQEELIQQGFSKPMADRIVNVVKISERQGDLVSTTSRPKVPTVKSSRNFLSLLTSIFWCAAVAIMAVALLVTATDSSNWPLLPWVLFLSISVVALAVAQLD